MKISVDRDLSICDTADVMFTSLHHLVNYCRRPAVPARAAYSSRGEHDTDGGFALWSIL